MIAKIRKYFYKSRSYWRGREDAMFEASSIGDMAFLLLIFFIVTSSFVLREGIFLSLPSNSAGSVKVEKEKILVVTPRQTDYTVDGKTISRSELLTRMEELRESQEKDAIVVIEMPSKIPYDRLIDTLSAVRESNIEKVSLKDI